MIPKLENATLMKKKVNNFETGKYRKIITERMNQDKNNTRTWKCNTDDEGLKQANK